MSCFTFETHWLVQNNSKFATVFKAFWNLFLLMFSFHKRPEYDPSTWWCEKFCSIFQINYSCKFLAVSYQSRTWNWLMIEMSHGQSDLCWMVYPTYPVLKNENFGWCTPSSWWGGVKCVTIETSIKKKLNQTSSKNFKMDSVHREMVIAVVYHLCGEPFILLHF